MAEKKSMLLEEKVDATAGGGEPSVVISILASRPLLINAHLATWIPYLPGSATVELAVDDRLYTQDGKTQPEIRSGKRLYNQSMKLVWDAVPLPKKLFSTSQSKSEQPYFRAAEVFLLAIKEAATSAQRGNFTADWFYIVDDDFCMNPTPVIDKMKAYNPNEALILGNAGGGCAPVCGGTGVMFSRQALKELDMNCWQACDPQMDHGDSYLGALVPRLH